MGIGEVMAFVRNDSIESFVPLSAVKTQGDVDRLNSEGYQVGYTLDEFQREYPDIDTDKIFFCQGFNPAYYFDRDRLILFILPLYHKDFITLCDSFAEHVQKGIALFERELNLGNYSVGFLALSDRLRMEYLNLCLDSGVTEGMYELFLGYYTLSDYGCDSISTESMRRMVESKTAAQKRKTTIALSGFPKTITLYRGEGERSTPTQKTWSWTMDINQANFFASRYGNKGARIITATVQKKDIVEYINDSRERECLVDPANITIIDTMELYGAELIDNINKETIVMFRQYRDTMNELLEFDSEIHGAAHTARVLFNSLLIADLLGLSEADKETLATAAIYHDIGRTNDDVDDNHGAASADYYKNDALYDEDYDPVVEFLIRYHSLPDKQGYAQIERDPKLSENKERSKLLFETFKDADGLDRIRFEIQELDIRQLRLPESKKMTMVARLILEGLKA